MTGLELALKIKQDELPYDKGYLIVNGATAHEFMAKWNELTTKHNSNYVNVWSDIVMLFDLEFHPDITLP